MKDIKDGNVETLIKKKPFMKGDQTPKSKLYFDGTDDGRGRGLGLQGVVPVGRLKS